MARKGTLPTAEAIREQLKAIGTQHGLGGAFNLAEFLQEGFEQLGGEALFVFQQSLLSVMRDKVAQASSS